MLAGIHRLGNPSNQVAPIIGQQSLDLVRGALVIGVSPAPHEAFDHHIPVADLGPAAAIVNAPPAQLLGYYLALLRGHDPDKPRNLAKSVTVK